MHHSRWDGEYLEFDPNNLNKGLNQILILPLGLKNGGTFYFLGTVLRGAKVERFALPFSWKQEMTDITDWFFETYEMDGRCIFDREHKGWLLGAENRFTYVNNTRKCNWCGQWQHKYIEKEQTIKRNEVWI